MSQQIEVPDHLYPCISRMISVLAAKKADYAGDDPWANFKATSSYFDLQLWEAAQFNVIQKADRIRNLRKGATPQNEPLEDTYLDQANFALLAYAMYLYEQAASKPTVTVTTHGARILDDGATYTPPTSVIPEAAHRGATGRNTTRG